MSSGVVTTTGLNRNVTQSKECSARALRPDAICRLRCNRMPSLAVGKYPIPQVITSSTLV